MSEIVHYCALAAAPAPLRKPECSPFAMCLFSRLLIVALAACTAAVCRQPRITPRQEVKFPPFEQRVRQYMELHRSVEHSLAPLATGASAAEVAARKKAFGDALRAARTDARQGDIFSPEVAPRFVAAVRSETQGRDGAPAKKTIREDNPASAGVFPRVRVAVNAVYPDSAPLSTMPPTLLLRLPALPKELEYRFVGRALVLRDVAAGLIVDFIPDALPPAKS